MGSDSDRRALDAYVADARRHPLLSKDEERECAERWRAHKDVAAREKLVLANLRFVLKIAHEYTGYGVSLRELVQEGNVGLLIAADRFEPARGLRFISYAVWWIRASMLAYVQRAISLVRMGTTAETRRAFFNVRRTRRRLEAEQQRVVSAAEIASALNVSEESIATTESGFGARDLAFDPAALDRMENVGPSPEESVAEAEVTHKERRRLRLALATLDPRERTIVERRHLTETEESLAAIGDALHVSRERVRQLESRALDKLRVALAA